MQKIPAPVGPRVCGNLTASGLERAKLLTSASRRRHLERPCFGHFRSHSGQSFHGPEEAYFGSCLLEIFVSLGGQYNFDASCDSIRLSPTTHPGWSFLTANSYPEMSGTGSSFGVISSWRVVAAPDNAATNYLHVSSSSSNALAGPSVPVTHLEWHFVARRRSLR